MPGDDSRSSRRGGQNQKRRSAPSSGTRGGRGNGGASGPRKNSERRKNDGRSQDRTRRGSGSGRGQGRDRDPSDRPSRREDRRAPAERRPDRDLAGPPQWGRIARRGAGNIDYDDPETIAAREERRERRRERAAREREAGVDETAETPRKRKERAPLPLDLEKTARGAVDRGRKSDSKDSRGRRPLPPRPKPVKDPAAVLKGLVGEQRGKSLHRRLRAASKAFEAERFDDARKQLGVVVKEAPELPEARELMGLSLYRLGKWKESVEQLEAFRDLSGSTEQHPVLADCHRALGNWSDVEELWSELGDASPSADLVTEGRIVMAGAVADQGDLTGAIRLLEQNWRPPKRPMGHHLRRAYALADLYDRAGRAPRARDLFSWVQGHAPDMADVRQRVKALS